MSSLACLATCQAPHSIANQCNVDLKCPGRVKGQCAELQFVSLLSCFQELLLECLVARSAFIKAQSDVLADAGGGIVKVPPVAAKDWIRGLLSSPAQLRSLDDATLVRYVKVCFSCVFS